MRLTNTARLAACCVASLLMAGCATRSPDVQPASFDASAFAGWDCERLQTELDRVQAQASERAYKVDERAGNNVVALGVGAMVFWPALLALRPDGDDAAELARLKGRAETLHGARRAQACPPPADELPAARAAALPIHLGERLVYEERAQDGAAAVELGLRLVALRRNELDFAVERRGQRTPLPWRQDLAGNTLPSPQSGLLQWRHLLAPELVLGQALSGELVAIDGDAELIASVSAQVMSLGEQTVAGRRFDVAVLELRGGAPHDNGGSTRLEGVMAVDRASGVLLRLELFCANPSFSIWRRLARIDAAP
jgi:hypothetical protein